jgi:glucose-1-phosphate thymidylyltransferase
VLLNVAGKPILAHILDKLLHEGVRDATIVVGYLGEKIREYVSKAYPGMSISYVEQEETLGLGHAIYLARESLNSDPVLIILGDTIFDVDLGPVLRSPFSSLGVKTVEDPRRFGVAVLRGEFIARLVEKPETPLSNLALVGLYLVRNPRLLAECLNALVDRDVRTRGEYQLTDALQMMVERGERMTTFPVEGWFDCGKPETLLATNEALLKKHPHIPSIPGVTVIPPVAIAPSASIERCVIGPNTTIGEKAVLRDAIIRNSIIAEGAQVHKALLENSIIGSGAVVQGRSQRISVGDSSEVELT